MNKGYFERVIKTTTFLIPSIIIFSGVTVGYINGFFAVNSQSSAFDKIIYWLTYLLISTFLQYVIFINAKKQILNSKKYKY